MRIGDSVEEILTAGGIVIGTSGTGALSICVWSEDDSIAGWTGGWAGGAGGGTGGGGGGGGGGWIGGRGWGTTGAGGSVTGGGGGGGGGGWIVGAGGGCPMAGDGLLGGGIDIPFCGAAGFTTSEELAVCAIRVY